MNKIDEINRYIKLTGVKYDDNTPYQMNLSEMAELSAVGQKDGLLAISIAFDYGRAKGERHARKELKKA